jgi:hypothetical protein
MKREGVLMLQLFPLNHKPGQKDMNTTGNYSLIEFLPLVTFGFLIITLIMRASAIEISPPYSQKTHIIGKSSFVQEMI